MVSTLDLETAAVAKKPKQQPDPPDVPAEPAAKPAGGRKTAPVQIDRELARMAAVIAAHDDTTLSDLLKPVLAPFIRMHYERVQREIQERVRQMRLDHPK